ncbi:hypothetical protein [Paraburkholderia caribensis]|uniref:Uncharacterized protein n=1 Tax=Paraburkholderia caribensis TaxID=75105 RepID=A0A9Q6S2X0_9BURK|nr:hypothetical protein [Paraburkholderia caribensis]QLB63476.1 hypothetical protein A9O66_14445 [Paraburkholderia caribensis]
MKKAALVIALLAASPAFSQTLYGNHSSNSMYGSSSSYGSDEQVSGYTRSNGTYVEPYHRTAPDSNPYNNYSTRGNVNPYTGQPGYKTPGY